MAWDRIHKVIGSNGQVTMTPGYLSETITLGNDADSSTSPFDYPLKSDITVLAKFSGDLIADTYVQIEVRGENSEKAVCNSKEVRSFLNSLSIK